MKNIYVIPTDKPSRLWINTINGELVLDKEANELHAQNIYITSDEKLPYDSSIFNSGAFYHRDPVGDVHIITKHTFKPNPHFCKRIILTTDQDLIKDGIQVIDDEFLEWFVENPSCEYVEVQESSYQKNLEKPIHKGLGVYRFDEMIRFLKIIIPQEETKQENRKICKCKRAYENPLSEICSLCWNELYPNEKDEIKEEDLLEPKQETLEIKDGNQPAYQFDEWNTLFELQSQCRKIGLSELEIHSVLSNRFELKKRNNI